MTDRISVCLAENGVGIHVFDDANPDGEKFLAWFDQHVLGLDSDEYRRAFWREVRQTGHTIGHVPRTLDTFLREHTACRNEQLGLLFAVVCLQAVCYGFWVIRRAVNLHLRRCRRGRHYLRERERRRALAADRRKMPLRRTANGKPTVEQIREAYRHVRDSPVHALRLGALLQDLECHVDNHPLIDHARRRIVGRAGGIRRHLQGEAPDLFDHYKSLMGYKARAKKYRQACGAADPVPVDALLPRRDAPSSTAESSPETPPSKGEGAFAFPDRPELRDPVALTEWMKTHGNTDYVRSLDWRREPAERVYTARHTLTEDAYALARKILSFGNGSLLALDAAIALEIDPDCVPEDLPAASRGTAGPQPHGTSPEGRRRSAVSRRVRDWIVRHRSLLRLRRGTDG